MFVVVVVVVVFGSCISLFLWN